MQSDAVARQTDALPESGKEIEPKMTENAAKRLLQAKNLNGAKGEPLQGKAVRGLIIAFSP
jgi:hypothetical protein